tara:strand:- start:44399 stop:44608 length:210 start_codon:yes stop_codon:yes gene_type:complete
MRPLIEYWNDSIDSISNLTDWKYVGKVVLVFLPVIFFTVWYYTLKGIWLSTEYINKQGDKFLKWFIQDD